MPPYLRHGIPVEQRIPPKPQPLHLCTCWQCFAQSAINPITLKVEQGAYVPWSVYRKHLDEDETRGIAPPEISNTVVGPQSCSSRSVPKPHSVHRRRLASQLSNRHLTIERRTWSAPSKISVHDSPPCAPGPSTTSNWSSLHLPLQHRYLWCFRGSTHATQLKSILERTPSNIQLPKITTC
jgi:hypothetical protein